LRDLELNEKHHFLALYSTYKIDDAVIATTAYIKTCPFFFDFFYYTDHERSFAQTIFQKLSLKLEGSRAY
jgi:hypothetical protein